MTHLVHPVSKGITSQYDADRLESEQRRTFLRNSALFTGAALTASAFSAAPAGAAKLAVSQSNKEMGREIEPEAYGMPSKFEAHVKRRRTDVLKNKQHWSDWSMTPIHQQPGIVTPNGLFYERHHAGTPDINPDEHALVIHGMVKQPLKFSMNDHSCATGRFPTSTSWNARATR